MVEDLAVVLDGYKVLFAFRPCAVYESHPVGPVFIKSIDVVGLFFVFDHLKSNIIFSIKLYQNLNHLLTILAFMTRPKA